MPSSRGRPGQVVIVGSLNFDHVISVERLPRPGETVSGHGYLAVPGGKGLNQAVTAARQGAEVAMVGCVGDDASGQRLLRVLSDEGISAKCSRTVAGVPSGTALITVASGGANTIVVAAGANHELRPADVGGAEAGLRPGVVVLAQLEVPIEAVQAAFSIARARGATTLLNPAPAPDHLPPDLLSLVDVLLPNETEALAISGQRTPDGAASWLLERGCGSVVVTLGERGALLAQPGEERGCRARPPGAGDRHHGRRRRLLRCSGGGIGFRGEPLRRRPLRLRGRRTGHHCDGGAPQPAEGGSGGTVVVRDLNPLRT